MKMEIKKLKRLYKRIFKCVLVSYMIWVLSKKREGVVGVGVGVVVREKEQRESIMREQGLTAKMGNYIWKF